MGLELSPSKTRIAHTLEEYNGEKKGFEFLGFRIYQFCAECIFYKTKEKDPITGIPISLCVKKRDEGYGYLYERHNTLTHPKIRCHFNSLPAPDLEQNSEDFSPEHEEENNKSSTNYS